VQGTAPRHAQDWGGSSMTALSTVVVGQLGTGGQLLLWALRQRLADKGETTPKLVQGFLLACGLAAVERALGSFERLFDCLKLNARCEVGVCPLRCACVSRDEATCLALLAAAQAGEAGRCERLAAALVDPERIAVLCGEARALAQVLAQAGHVLSLPPSAAVREAVLH
jgi:hypothetical protein